MIVLAAVPRISAARLQHAVGKRFAFLPAQNWADAFEAIRTEPLEMAVMDPALGGQPRGHEIERVCMLFPSLPVIVYTRLAPAVVPVLLRLGQAGIDQVVVAGHDDHAQRLGDILVTAAARTVSRRLVDELGDVLRDFPGELKWALETMIREPASFHTVQDLAERARMDRRTCARWFTKAQLPPPSTVLTIFRVLYAHRLLQDPGYTVEDVAAKLGYARTRSFTQSVKEVFGMTPGELKLSLTTDDALRIVREQLFGRPAAPPAVREPVALANVS